MWYVQRTGASVSAGAVFWYIVKLLVPHTIPKLEDHLGGILPDPSPLWTRLDLPGADGSCQHGIGRTHKQGTAPKDSLTINSNKHLRCCGMGIRYCNELRKHKPAASNPFIHHTSFVTSL